MLTKVIVGSQFVTNSNHDYFKYSVLRLTFSLEKPHEAQSQFAINSNQCNDSFQIFCGTYLLENLNIPKFS